MVTSSTVLAFGGSCGIFLKRLQRKAWTLLVRRKFADLLSPRRFPGHSRLNDEWLGNAGWRGCHWERQSPVGGNTPTTRSRMCPLPHRVRKQALGAHWHLSRPSLVRLPCGIADLLVNGKHHFLALRFAQSIPTQAAVFKLGRACRRRCCRFLRSRPASKSPINNTSEVALR